MSHFSLGKPLQELVFFARTPPPPGLQGPPKAFLCFNLLRPLPVAVVPEKAHGSSFERLTWSTVASAVGWLALGTSKLPFSWIAAHWDRNRLCPNRWIKSGGPGDSFSTEPRTTANPRLVPVPGGTGSHLNPTILPVRSDLFCQAIPQCRSRVSRHRAEGKESCARAVGPGKAASAGKLDQADQLVGEGW